MADHGEMASDVSEAPAVSAGAAGRSPKRQRHVLRGLLAVLGLELVGTGIAGIFTANSEAGAATLVGAGSLLVLLVRSETNSNSCGSATWSSGCAGKPSLR
jgi:hypothetical protein